MNATAPTSSRLNDQQQAFVDRMTEHFNDFAQAISLLEAGVNRLNGSVQLFQSDFKLKLDG